MNIHEYQGKQVLAEYGVAVPRGHVAFTVDEAVKAAEELGGDVFVVKSQIHAGGRGAGRFKDKPDGKGGVRVVKTVDEVRENAAEMLNHVLVTKQTGPDGKEVKRLYIEEGCDIARELYMGMLLDRQSSRLLIMASTEGGMEIEEVAEATPEKILKVVIDPATGIRPYHARQLAFGLGLEGAQIKSAIKLIISLYQAFNDLDCSMVEINPLVVTGAGDVMALDAKVGFDDNALYRHKDVADMRDEEEEDAAELEAGKWDLNYVKLDGEIGCMVNGAGLAMATMDIIKLEGSEPANFLDVGGGATAERVTAAFKIILSDPNVKGILVNIFGGIMRCDVIANGVVAAAQSINLKKPIVIRLQGTNVDEAKSIIESSGFRMIVADDLDDAATKAVRIADICRQAEEIQVGVSFELPL